MTIIPQPGYLLLEEIKPAIQNEAGIILTEEAYAEGPELAKVLSIGGSLPTNSTGPVVGITEGCTVLFKRHLFREFELDKKKYLIGKEDGVEAIIHD